jgi:hypothetical protein
MAGMRVRTLREGFPPIIALIAGLVILVSAVVTGYTGKIHSKGVPDLYRATDPKTFRNQQILAYVIAALFLGYWIFSILEESLG